MTKLKRPHNSLNLIAATAIVIGLSFFDAERSFAQTEADASIGANCTYNKTTPIIPDGNIASQDELISAQKRIKLYQESLLDFRECLLEAEKNLDANAENYQATKSALTARSDKSIDIEKGVAAEFNEAIRIYKER